jgi:poly-gamma-glutamate capsule biosynthesis protein CapA/YwtB (metallophosphatase superfamily)
MITIGLTGDVMIGRLVEEVLDQNSDPAYVWGNLLPELHSSDLNLINLEAALTTSVTEVPKVFNFKAKPQRVEVLQQANIQVANLANNHSLDYGVEGLLETLEVLKRANIHAVGAGDDIDSAKASVILNIKDIKIGILGFTDNEPSWMASKSSPGTNYIRIDEEGLQALSAEIEKLRSKVNLIILTIHWGPNMRERPPTYFKSFAHQAIEGGVDIFHGHSAHIFQGIEIYKDKLIIYDSGDLVDDYYVDPNLRNDCSFYFTVQVSKQGIESVTLLPILISNCQVNLSTGIDRERTIRRMQLLSEELSTRFEHIPQGLRIIL